MVVKKFNKNVKLNKKIQEKKNVEKEPIVESSDNESFDDMSEEELKKMLGNSDNSDIESDDFSEEVFVESNEAKVGKKRKLDTDDEEDFKDAKKSKCGIDAGLGESEDDDNEDDDDEDDDDEMDDDSFIDDDDNIEEDDESSVPVNDINEVKKTTNKIENKKEKEIKVEAKKAEKSNKIEENKIKEKKIKVERTQENEEFKKIYDDTPQVESESLRKEMKDRIITRKNKTLVLLGLPPKFNQAQAKEMIPDMVSIILPYNVHRHQINGNAYIDVSAPELVSKYISKLKGFKIKGRKLSCLPLNKADDNVDNYNCTRLAISNLSAQTTPEILKRIMVKATTIKMLPVKKVDKRVTLTAFAEYPSVEDAIFDYDTKHGIEVEGNLINVKFQSKSNTNIKKGISWDKTALRVIGINKAVREDDIKKLFPQATKIHWKVGDQVANINYENTEDCSVDFSNSVKNKPHGNMKIFYKCLTHKTDKNDSKFSAKKPTANENVKEKKKEIPEKKDFKQKKQFVKKEVATEQGEVENKPNFKNKPKFNGKGKFNGAKKEFNGVKKTNFKPSHNNKKPKNSPEKEKTLVIKLNTVGQFKVNEKMTGYGKSNNKDPQQKIAGSEEKNSEKIEKKNNKEKTNYDPTSNHEMGIEKIKSEKRRNKKEKKIKSDLINKKKQEKRAKKVLKKKLKKEKLAKQQNKL